jgi:hypothetical protein
MTTQEQLSLADQYANLWRGLLPQDGAPPLDQFLYWSGKFPEELVVRGINRAARKVRKLRDTTTPMTLDAAIRYASSVMTHEMLNERRFSTNTTGVTI